ncbi:HAD-IIA family hydrolase [Actinomyces slackii]|uniref:Uncharacterized hydrolase yutF n=2 Tax=Actinomyces slackii TaxID=52774 RepID=A0A3S4SGG7_9ACTO|nr:HAD-IIA family hydrolase [Actinomyces slackii]VEG75457.1 Uncharacterized hydrolase yutF [Actinomyces slackii]
MITSAQPGTQERVGLLAATEPLCEIHDVALLDLDGVCFAGNARIAHAADSVNGARSAGMRMSFVTNNASRTPQAVADKLADNGIQASPAEVFSAAMDGAALLAEHVPAGATVLVVGGDGVREALIDQGYQVTDTAEHRPAAVVQGWDPGVDWALLSEALYAISQGALHVATNLDSTLPTERGFALGNGSLVAAVVNATGVQPLAGGKPTPGIYQRALARAGGSRPLAVGDRLNTDLVGARTAGFPGLHVLTGVSRARDVILAGPHERPSYLHTDLRGLTEPHPAPHAVEIEGATWWQVSQQRARVVGGRLELDGSGLLTEPGAVRLDAYRALVAAAWDHADTTSGDSLQVPELDVLAP